MNTIRYAISMFPPHSSPKQDQGMDNSIKPYLHFSSYDSVLQLL